MTRSWVTVGTSGVPFGVQVASPPTMTIGWPFEVTRVVPVSHWAVTHDGMPDGGMPGQSAIVH